MQPSLVTARNVLAKLYLQSGQNRLAIKECRQALQNDPSDQTALYHLILALRKTSDQTRNSGTAQATGAGSPRCDQRRSGAESLQVDGRAGTLRSACKQGIPGVE